MAFSASEVRVLRRALTVAMRAGRDSVDFWLLGRAIGEAADERERLRAFMTAELRRYRSALPGSAASFLGCLRSAVDDVAHVPSAEDLAALRATVDLPCGERERASRAALLRRCTRLAENDLEQRLAARARRRAEAAAARAAGPDPVEILIPTRPRPAAKPVPARAAELCAPFRIEAVPLSADLGAPPEPAVPTAEFDEATPPEPVDAPADEPRPTVVPYREDPPTPADPGTDDTRPDAETSDTATSKSPDIPKTSDTDTDTVTRTTHPAHPGPSSASEPASEPEPEPEPEPASESALGPESGASPEPLSPVIPHRRHSRALGQLPTPEILQAGTG